MTKARLPGNLKVEPSNQGFARFARGSSTLEILIAFASNQAVAVDTQTSNEALGLAQAQLEEARARSRQDFALVSSSSGSVPSGPLTYNASLAVSDQTQCLKHATSTVTWPDGGRTQTISLSTFFSDIAGTFALGGDCASSPPSSDWTNPQRFASDTMDPGKPTTINVLQKIVYVGADKTPYLYIADTTGAVLGQSSGLFVTYANSFDLGKQPNSLDAIRWYDSATARNRYYAFAAVASTTEQLQVIDVTDIYNPAVVAKRTLSPCVSGSFPEGWVVYYYDGNVYMVTRETAGPELHVFNASDPSNPIEYAIGSVACKGYGLNGTVESMVVKDQTVSGVTKRFAYLATDQNPKELRVFDVTDHPRPTEVLAASQNLPGNQDGATIFNVGNKLYFGRQSASGPDLYVFDISNPPSGTPIIGSKDIGTGVIGLAIAGRFAFMATPKANQEFQVWDISNLTNISNVSKYNFGTIVANGVEYGPDFIYTTGKATPNLQVLYSAPP